MAVRVLSSRFQYDLADRSPASRARLVSNVDHHRAALQQKWLTTPFGRSSNGKRAYLDGGVSLQKKAFHVALVKMQRVVAQCPGQSGAHGVAANLGLARPEILHHVRVVIPHDLVDVALREGSPDSGSISSIAARSLAVPSKRTAPD